VSYRRCRNSGACEGDVLRELGNRCALRMLTRPSPYTRLAGTKWHLGVAVPAAYTIDGGQAGKARLDVLARVCAPGTTALLDRLGVGSGARCVDIGCGGGHVTRELALRVGSTGSVVGVDLDATVVELARADATAAQIANIEFRIADAVSLEPSTYDVAYARCLLSHVDEPGRVAAAMMDALIPSGRVIVEDVDFTGYFCRPPLPAHDKYVAFYRETVRRRGGNADLGPELPRILLDAGFVDVGVAVSHACALDGEPKLIPPLTLERISGAVVAEGVADAEEVAQAVGELYVHAEDPTTVMGMPRLVQAWGRKPA
jgi:SAM-dependent methyltransferase